MNTDNDSFFSAERVHMRSDLPVWVEKSSQMRCVVHHTHEFIEVVLVVTGSAQMEHDAPDHSFRKIGLVPGDLFSILQNEGHAYKNCENLLLYNIYIQPGFIESVKELRELSGWEKLFCRNEKDDPQVLHLPGFVRQKLFDILDRAVYECRMRPPGFMMMVRNLILECLIEACRAITPTRQDFSAEEPEILRTIRMIEDNPERQWLLKDLSVTAKMSLSSYTRKFRKITGLSPLDYIMKRRLQIVCRYLTSTEKNIGEIANLSGFCTPNYLTKIFRRQYGMTPHAYRQQWLKATLPFSGKL